MEQLQIAGPPLKMVYIFGGSSGSAVDVRARNMLGRLARLARRFGSGCDNEKYILYG